MTTLGSAVVVKNAIVSGNTLDNCDTAQLGGAISSQGNNISSDESCPFTQSTDKRNTNPLLGPLQDNGGPTDTRALLAGSPATDAGSNAACPTTDQRGVERPQGTACDMGAFEKLNPPDTTKPTLKSLIATSRSTTGVPRRNTNFVATFSEPMNKGTLRPATFKLYRCASPTSTVCNTPTYATVTPSSNGFSATLNPFETTSAVLLANTRYKVVVTTGAKDLAGNALAQQKVAFFKTGST